MRKILLFVSIIASTLLSNAQDSVHVESCQAYFKYEINTEVKTLLPATAINFIDCSRGDVAEWFWDFGDGNTSNEPNPMHIFNHPSALSYNSQERLNPYRTVNLTILTSDGCKSFYSETIQILGIQVPDTARCLARFKYYQHDTITDDGYSIIQFYDRSEGNDLKYEWYFDGLATSNEHEPMFRFDFSQPSRKVCLTVTNPEGCSDHFCDEVFIYDKPIDPDPIDTSNVDCFVAFGYYYGYSDQSDSQRVEVNFYSKIHGEPEKVLWDFGDGNTSNDINPVHSYLLTTEDDSTRDKPILHQMVCLTVTTTTGCESSFCEVIYIKYSDIYPDTTFVDPDTTFIDPACKAYFKYFEAEEVAIIPELKPIHFFDASGGNITDRLWRFADGTTSNEKEVLMTFDIFKPTQFVCLTVFSADGCSDTYCDTISISRDEEPYEPIYYGDFSIVLKGEYPIWASSCIGTASARLLYRDSVFVESKFYWFDGSEGDFIKGLCPTQKYHVTAVTPDGYKFTTSFRFNSDGSIDQIPVNWWIWNDGDKTSIQYDAEANGYIAEWVLCNGTVVVGNEIPNELFNCGDSLSNLIVKDSAGNIVYSETVSKNSIVSKQTLVKEIPSLSIYPNPVKNVLYIRYEGETRKAISVEVFDFSGRVLFKNDYQNIHSGTVTGVDVSSLQAGAYYVRVISGKEILAKSKILK